MGSYRRRNHPCQILRRLVKGLWGYGYLKFGVSHWLWIWMSLLQQCYALTCYTVMLASVETKTSRCTARWPLQHRLSQKHISAGEMMSRTGRWSHGCPEQSYVLLVMFSILPCDLELPRLIAVKLCHMIGIRVRFGSLDSASLVSVCDTIYSYISSKLFHRPRDPSDVKTRSLTRCGRTCSEERSPESSEACIGPSGRVSPWTI